ncbi:MAG: tRNA lysidine(34) synthetase TilS [Gemmatimonadales bacterium]
MSGGRTFLERVRERVERDRLFPEPGVALVAVSGGPDSVALLDVMARLAPDFGLELGVAHVDHGIAADSARVGAAVSELAAHYGMPFHCRRLELGSGASETKAREARYAALRALQAATEARYVVLGHHADDQLETVLLRFLRGSGVAGLAGMSVKGEQGLVRPLLGFGRDELREWLKQAERERGFQVPVHHDPANVDERHERSWLRHRVVPVLRERFGSELSERLSGVARHAASERRAWRALLRELSELEFRDDRGVIEVARAPLEKYDKVLSQALLRALGREVGLVVGPKTSARLLRFVLSAQSGRRAEVGRGWELELAFDRLRLVPEGVEVAPPAAVCGDLTEGVVWWDGWELGWLTEPAGVLERCSWTTWITPGEAVLRAPLPGDRVVPLGGVGRRRVRRLLMEARVARGARDRYPLVARGQDILWIPGICRGEIGVPRSGERAHRLHVRREPE